MVSKSLVQRVTWSASRVVSEFTWSVSRVVSKLRGQQIGWSARQVVIQLSHMVIELVISDYLIGE
jgi:hypothetical protein